MREYMEENPRMVSIPLTARLYVLGTFLRTIHDYMVRFSNAAERQYIENNLLGVRNVRSPRPQIPDMMESLFEFFRTRLLALRELRAELVNTRHTLEVTMLSFAMGTHNRLGERSWVRILGPDDLSNILDLWPVE
jgi:hypothetical protein